MEYLTVKEYAAKHGVSRNAIQSRLDRGIIAGAIKRGYQWFIPADSPYIDHRQRKYSTRWKKK